MVALQWSDRLAGVYRLDCEHCPREKKCKEWGADGVQYKHEGRDLLGRKWGRCPADYLNDPNLLLAVELYAATKISPLANWPDGWAAWVRDYMIAIDRAIKERKAHDLERL